MHTKVVLATSEEHYDLIAKNFEETVTLGENYQVTPESVQKRKVQLKKWAADENARNQQGSRLQNQELNVREGDTGFLTDLSSHSGRHCPSGSIAGFFQQTQCRVSGRMR